MLSSVLGGTLVATGACSPPMTDIVATNTEFVGEWDVANAQANGGTLKADVCMSNLEAADEVSDRLLMQLRSRGFERIDLALIGKDSNGSVQQRGVVWTPREGKQMQAAGSVGEDRCASAPGGESRPDPGKTDQTGGH
jgi:hypothetical protein